MSKNDVKALKQVCGIIMPISSIDGCSENHWVDILHILFDSVQNAGFEPNLVSNADDIGVIQKRIVQNIYDNPIVICDVSGKNPNVMFELGMRLAFDKPTIIVKDDKTSYSFDTSPIEHIEYPRDLRFNKITEFKEKLTEKIIRTKEAADNDPNFSTFLKHFGEFKIARIDQKEVSEQEYILDELRNIRNLLQANRKSLNNKNYNNISENNNMALIAIIESSDFLEVNEIAKDFLKNPSVNFARVELAAPSTFHIELIIDPWCDTKTLIKELESVSTKKLDFVVRVPKFN